MDRIDHIRKSEKEYHDQLYNSSRLFEDGTWLHLPVKIVMDYMETFGGEKDIQVLDLGSGVGRNSIPIAQLLKQLSGRITCVDLLPSALDHLRSYSKEYQVEEYMEMILIDIENFEIQPNHYDYIISVSALEHLRSETGSSKNF